MRGTHRGALRLECIGANILASKSKYSAPANPNVPLQQRRCPLTGSHLRYLRNTLRERGDVYVTTFFDLYGLKPDFPGIPEAAGIADPILRATTIEARFAEAVVSEAQCREDRFVPHIQPYEFEALLFSDVNRFPEVQSEWQAYVTGL